MLIVFHSTFITLHSNDNYYLIHYLEPTKKYLDKIMDINRLKKLAAEKAVEEISSGMIVGLGSGSTVQFALGRIAERIKNGELKNIQCIPSSYYTEAEAIRLGIPLVTLNEVVEWKIEEGKKERRKEGRRYSEDRRKNTEVGSRKLALSSEYPASSIQNPESLNILHSTFYIDITIDGADEAAVDCPEPDLSGEGSYRINLIKGGGGAMLREKILAQASKRLIIIVDESKISKHLGTKWPVPIEVIPFAENVEQKYLESLGAKVVKRKKTDGSDYITDENNFILDADFGEIKNPEELSVFLNQRAGIVEHGLFIGITSELICAMENGKIRIQK
jgi:ribose 5-phosphate isomerase A